MYGVMKFEKNWTHWKAELIVHRNNNYCTMKFIKINELHSSSYQYLLITWWALLKMWEQMKNYIVPYSLLWRAEPTMEHVHGSMVKADDGWWVGGGEGGRNAKHYLLLYLIGAIVFRLLGDKAHKQRYYFQDIFIYYIINHTQFIIT